MAQTKHLDTRKIDPRLAVTLESAEQNIEVLHRFRALGFVGHAIEMSGRFDFRCIMKLVRIIRTEKIDIIHSHGYKSDILGLIAGRIAGIRIVSTPHGFENARDLKLRFFIRAGCIALGFFDRVAPLSQELVQDMLRIGIPKSKTGMIENGVDLSELEEEKRKKSARFFPDNREKRIGFVGNLIGRKNLKDMIDAFDLLSRRYPSVRLILIGDGPMRRELETRAGSLPSGDRIEFWGYRDDRLQIVEELDLFAMTSALEGIPRCLMEAMGLDVPVVAYDIPGVDRLIENGRTGLSVPFGDITGLAACWERILNDPALSEKLARNGRAHILRRFSAQRMAREYENLYQEMVTK